MEKIRKIALIVWLVTLVAFVPLSTYPTIRLEIETDEMGSLILGLIVLGDVFLGVISFVVLVIADTAYNLKRRPNIKRRSVILLLVFFYLLFVLTIFVVDSIRNKKFDSTFLTDAQDSSATATSYSGFSNLDAGSVREDETSEQQIYRELEHGYSKEPILNLKYENYMVRGRTRDDLCRSVFEWQKEHNMGRTLAYVNYQLYYEASTIQNSKGFTIGPYKVIVDAKIMLPKWESSGGASEGTKSDWRAFKNAVESHERQHYEIVVKYAKKLVEEYNNMAYYTTRAEAEKRIQDIYYDIHKQMQKEQKKFDEREGESKSFSYLCR